MANNQYERVVVCGLGKSGSSISRFFLDHMEGYPSRFDDGFSIGSLTIYGGRSADSASFAVSEFTKAGVDVIFDEDTVQGTYDLAVISPGIPVHSQFYQSAKACATEIISEPEMAFRTSPVRWIGITGTNGKTTTTTLVTALLESGGLVARPSGNIGLPCIEATRTRRSTDFIVAELSSFQLTSMPSFNPMVAILLNITPDHVEWHGSLEEYAQAKANIFRNQTPDSYAVVDCTAPLTRGMVENLVRDGHSVICIGGPEGLGQRWHPADQQECNVKHRGSAYVQDGQLCVEVNGQQHLLAKVDELRIKGGHNVQNALASAAAAVVCGVADSDIIKGLQRYTPMEHRIEPCGKLGDITFYNDSKATNTDAADKALTAFEDQSVIILLGGHDKGTDLAELARDCVAKCKACVCFGEAGPRFYDALVQAKDEVGGNDCQLLQAQHLQQALDAALSVASGDDVVLLSPACSSFDEFSSFEQRGTEFKKMVAAAIKAANR